MSIPGKPLLLLLAGFIGGAISGVWFSEGCALTDASRGPETAYVGSVSTGRSATSSSKGPASDAVPRLLDQTNAGGLDRARGLIAFVDSLKPGEFEASLNEVFARRKGNQGYDLISNLYQKWVEIDPAAAIAHAESLEEKDRKTALMTVLSAWAAKEPYEALAWIEGHEKTHETTSAFHTIFRTIAQTDPEEAIALAERSKRMNPSGYNTFVNGWSPEFMGMDTSSLYGIWAEKDPGAAAARALTIPSSQERSNAIMAVGSQWARADPTAVWEWANGLERAPDRRNVLHNIIAAVVGNGDTSQALALFETMPPGQGRSDALQQVASFLANSDPDEAYAFVMQHAVSDRDRNAFSNVLRQWAKTDPGRAFELALNDLDPGNARRSAIQSIINEAANRDPALALKMMEKLDGRDWESVTQTVATTFARKDLRRSLVWAEGLPEGRIKDGAISEIISQWSREAPEQAALYGAKIKNDDLRQTNLRNTLSRWAQQDAVEAMTWAVENLDKEDQDHLIPQSLIHSWANQDAGAASEWVAALPEGELRKRSISSLISSWADDDLVATGEWIKRLPRGESRDEAAERYSDQVFQTDPEAALAWAGSIGDEERRTNQMKNFARRYLDESPDKAKRWITNSSLPPETKTDLLKDVP